MPTGCLSCQVRDLLTCYVDAIDGEHWEVLPEVFTPDASFDLTDIRRGTLHGIEAIMAYMRDDAIHPMAHLLANVHVVSSADENGDTHVRSRLLAVQGDGTVIVGTYHDRIVRSPGAGLRIAERRFEYVRRHHPAAKR